MYGGRKCIDGCNITIHDHGVGEPHGYSRNTHLEIIMIQYTQFFRLIFLFCRNLASLSVQIFRSNAVEGIAFGQMQSGLYRLEC